MGIWASIQAKAELSFKNKISNWKSGN